MNVLERVPGISTVRRNHGIEHATVYVLSRQRGDRRLVARSNTRGFVIFGDVTIDELRAAVTEAIQRLQRGEANLAVHPNCGTNFVTSGMLAGLAAWAVTSLGNRQRSIWEQMPAAFMAATLALFVAQPVGHSLQEHVTTSPLVAGIRLGSITRQGNMGHTPVHFVELLAA